MKKSILAILIILFLSSNFTFAQEKIEVNFFYSAICPHCAEEKEFLENLKNKYPEIEVKEYEIIYHPENKEILKDFYEKYQVPAGRQGWVPLTFTPTKYFLGFDQQIGEEIEHCLKECLGEGAGVVQKIKIPIFGEIELSELSLPALTVVLAALDGFNPCAMWVLLFLIALLINVRSRKKIWLVGGTFIAVSGIVYFLLLGAWLNLFLAISYVNLTRILIGVFALGAGVWQIKNFIAYQPGVCKVLGLRSKLEKGLREKAEKIVNAPILVSTFLSIAALAVGVNLVEFFCSAGLPAIYTKILTLSVLNLWSYYLYLLLYVFVFLLDDLIIFSLAIITLSKIGFTEKYSYWATLIGGLLIFILGVLLIFKPEWLMFG